MSDPFGEQRDPQLRFIHELIDENVPIAGDVAEIDDHTWAIHGLIPGDGDVIVAEYPSYGEARGVLDGLATDPL